MYYLKFYCKLNRIEYFQYDRKSWTKKNNKYNIKRLIDDTFKALAQVKGSTFLRYYKSYLKEIDLYWEKIQYETNEQKKFTLYKKTWAVHDNKWVT